VSQDTEHLGKISTVFISTTFLTYIFLLPHHSCFKTKQPVISRAYFSVNKVSVMDLFNSLSSATNHCKFIQVQRTRPNYEQQIMKGLRLCQHNKLVSLCIYKYFSSDTHTSANLGNKMPGQKLQKKSRKQGGYGKPRSSLTF